MARRVFFSFHYQRDIWRVNQIRNLGEIIGSSAAGFQDASLWEEAKIKGDAEIKRLIDEGLERTSVTVVCIGAKTAGRKYINYEINQSIARGNGIIGLRINHLKDKLGHSDDIGDVPSKLISIDVPIYKYVNSDKLKMWIEQAAYKVGK